LFLFPVAVDLLISPPNFSRFMRKLWEPDLALIGEAPAWGLWISARVGNKLYSPHPLFFGFFARISSGVFFADKGTAPPCHRSSQILCFFFFFFFPFPSFFSFLPHCINLNFTFFFFPSEFSRSRSPPPLFDCLSQPLLDNNFPFSWLLPVLYFW